MKTLVISDIHGNWSALEAVLCEPHEAVVCLGDLVGYGPQPAACVEWARSSDVVCVMGNHDRAAAEGVAPGCREQFRWLAAAVAPLTRAQLSEEDLAYLRKLPRFAALDFMGVGWACVHAAPLDPLYRYVGPSPEEWAGELLGTSAPMLLVGHTHIQFDLMAGATRVINPGSVGQPKDGDPRAAYAVIEDGRVSLQRVAYPIERTVRLLRHAGLPQGAVGALTTLLRTGQVPPPTVTSVTPH